MIQFLDLSIGKQESKTNDDSFLSYHVGNMRKIVKNLEKLTIQRIFN